MIELDYSNTGIKTLRVIGLIFLFTCIIAGILLIPLWYTKTSYGYGLDYSEFNPLYFILSIISAVSGFFLHALCLSIAIIAENALIQKSETMKKFYDDE